jgi:hypothetical protein
MKSLSPCQRLFFKNTCCLLLAVFQENKTLTKSTKLRLVEDNKIQIVFFLPGRQGKELFDIAQSSGIVVI